MNQQQITFTDSLPRTQPGAMIPGEPRYRVIHNLSGKMLISSNYLDFIRMELSQAEAKNFTIHDQHRQQFFNADSIFNAKS